MLNKTNKNLIIPIDRANDRLDQALAILLPDYSRTQIHQCIKDGKVLVNNFPMKASTRLKGGENISIEIETLPEIDNQAQNIPLTIVYEDASLLVINKPAGLVVHPGAGRPDHTLLNALLYYLPDLKMLPRAGIIHRLDKDTSGLLMIAKTAKAFKSLTIQLKKRTILREYQAIVYGSLISGGTIDKAIARHHFKRKQMSVSEVGKPAITHYRIGERYRFHTLLRLKLETGRTHQIRVHMAHIRHPLVGDNTYGGQIQLQKGMSTEMIAVLREFKRQALHAFVLGLTHPETNEWMQWEIELPTDIIQLIKMLRDDSNDVKHKIYYA